MDRHASRGGQAHGEVVEGRGGAEDDLEGEGLSPETDEVEGTNLPGRMDLSGIRTLVGGDPVRKGRNPRNKISVLFGPTPGESHGALDLGGSLSSPLLVEDGLDGDRRFPDMPQGMVFPDKGKDMVLGELPGGVGDGQKGGPHDKEGEDRKSEEEDQDPFFEFHGIPLFAYYCFTLRYFSQKFFVVKLPIPLFHFVKNKLWKKYIFRMT